MVCVVLIALSASNSCRIRRENDDLRPAEVASAPEPKLEAPRAPAPAVIADASADVSDASEIEAAASTEDAAPDAPLDAALRGAAVVAHGGAGTAPGDSHIALSAVHTTLASLAAGAEAVEAAARGVAVLEDAPVFNAGTGSSVRLDDSLQMDAAVMDSTGRWSAVIAIERVKNPVLVALSALQSGIGPIAGEGAAAFARTRGHADWDPTTPSALERHERALASVAGPGDAAPPDWSSLNRDASAPTDAGADAADARAPSFETGSVAVLVRVRRGTFAGAVSDGGPALALRGQLGSAGVRSAALHVGSGGAVAVSGGGARVVQDELARAVYARMQLVLSAKAAAEWGVDQVDLPEPVAISALNELASHTASTSPVAWAAWARAGPETGADAAP